MASWQHQLLSRIVRSGNLNEVLEWGITQGDFTQSETLGMFQMVAAYNATPETAGSVWGPNALAQRFPNFVLCDDPGMTTEALCKEVRADRIKTQTRQLLLQVDNIVDADPTAAVNLLAQQAIDMQNDCSPKKVDVHLADGVSRVWQQYCAIERGERVSLAPWPWEPMQTSTLGLRPTDYMILYGRPKSMKTWVLCYLIAWFISLECGMRILIYTKEMDADEMFERIACVLAKADYERFTQGALTPEERAEMHNVVEWLTVMRETMMVVCLSAQDVAPGQDTVQWLQSKVDHYKPHACFVDGMYLMSDATGARKMNERVAAISRAMRQLILRNKIPVVATVQANRDAAKNEEANTEEVAFSDSLGQDCTMLIRVVNEWKKGKETLALVMGGATRRYKLDGFRIYGYPAHNFGYYGELSSKDAERAVRGDDEVPDNRKKREPRKMDERRENLDSARGVIEAQEVM
jgi:hypothetical protein